ncbi:MAG: methylcobamide--CoM methyltransferase [Candidatus Raymondbacteria bacterium RifOxyC12_full_50_8]|uniref:Methylcobamide--CoM methyltransferase n=1 Tax=Candidatus Raymondbacteria bacterium RIFOXYD12_FULL_49_13 TaxID=1817890 RepID=A0A1F7FI89_UNCRA|nr:MAG: methylcobamide--CoM methyltransferase [Candidatus Raymondbacteria bacterium RIFOXYA2_FULL_49_16]OGJ95718.1 MAG: methylcobamide--CoM methyltransferase [Candidatus Raymondbacteria bacterium RifOxyB12_full_50_8]OGK05972.1 MAG: methylcobamide--CoM methyltransferase [Candidatus Raymondbacteria bacterium RifOxyC12_full_50_8]OGK06291.1 MAG: methylcobamide--CoM methyltransferase [Candidatus Raymondbacteria bacterium RIFOXYD12_FULL_49_13]OGP40623.1 MAG: methylcobamide--CoM methyltransferase [Can
MVRTPMTKEQTIKAIEREGCEKIPLVLHKWWGNGLEEKYGPALQKMAANYPDDICSLWYEAPGSEDSSLANPSYRWGYKKEYASAERHSIGSDAVLLPDWSEWDRFIADFPNPNEPGNFAEVEKNLKNAHGRYLLGGWWRLFHERFWGIRGMENLMIDYFDNMDKLKELGWKLVEFYTVIIDRYAALGFDGIFSSDDLGHQAGPMMDPDCFRELYLPLYKEVIGHAHRKGMHFLLHSCGDNTLLMDMLIEAGLDVFHPIQKGCMDEKATNEKFGAKMSFLAGVDVQHLLPEGSVEEVRKGVRDLIDALWKPEGGLLLAAGNGIMPDTPLENIDAMLREMALYK